MKSNLPAWKFEVNSPLFYGTLLVPIAIVAIGINFVVNPAGASIGFGIPIYDPAAFPYLRTKGVRDIFSGLVMLPFLFRGNRHTVATILAISILIPAGDGLIVLRHLGFAPQIFIHWGTALYMVIVAALLLRRPSTSQA
jgi:Domain of unknown function (DUF4267)